MFRRPVFWASCVAMLLGLGGCGPKGGSALKTVPVAGAVTHNGKPIEGATVTFLPVDPNSGKAAGGITDAAGKFTLETYAGGSTVVPGALLGDYNVTVTKTSSAVASSSTDAMMTMTNPEGMQQLEKGGGVKPGEDAKATAPVVAAPTGSGPESLLPKKYSDPATSTFKANVPAGGKSDFSFDLTDD